MLDDQLTVQKLSKYERYITRQLYLSLTIDKFKNLKDQIKTKINVKYFTDPISEIVFKMLLNFEKHCLPVDDVQICAEVEKVINQPFNSNFFIEYFVDEMEFKYLEFNKISDTLEGYHKKRAVIEYLKSIDLTDLSILKVNDKIEDICNTLKAHSTTQSNLIKLYDLLVETDQNLKEKDIEHDVIKTGFFDLDSLMKLKKGQLVTLAGRPGMGKTTFALNLANNFEKQKYNVLIYSLEMGKGEIGEKLLSTKTHVSQFFLKSHYDVHVEKIKKRIEFSKDSNFYVSSVTDITTINIESDLLTLKNQNINVDVIIIDYLQLMNTIEDSGNRVQEISKLTRELKKIALRSNVLLISLSQLSRELEKRADKIPYLSDLRESGSIEQDSDIVMFVYRHEYYKPTERKNEVDIIIAKQRNGGLGTIQMVCELPKSLFTDMVK